MCGANVYEGKKSYFCKNWNANPKCAFTIWKIIAHASLTVTDATILLSGGTTKEKKMKNKDGKVFSAKLRLDKEHKVAFVSDAKKGEGKTKKNKPNRKV